MILIIVPEKKKIRIFHNLGIGLCVGFFVLLLQVQLFLEQRD